MDPLHFIQFTAFPFIMAKRIALKVEDMEICLQVHNLIQNYFTFGFTQWKGILTVINDGKQYW